MAFWQNTPSTQSKLNATNLNNLAGGWTKIIETLTYSSADSPTFVATTSADLTSYISVGMKIKLTQTTIKYFIVTAITSTTITLYGGTDYTLANASISDVYFSVHKSPYGFPISPDKWAITVTSNGGTQSNPTQNQWYYTPFGSTNITLPIGCWHVTYQLTQGCNRTTSSDLDNVTALSLSSSTQSGGISTRVYTIGTNITINETAQIPIVVTTKTPYYIIAKTQMTTVAGLAVQTIKLQAICCYL